ncbi:hypothetical protein CR103_01040 [Massilia psychrophila]|uniref:SLC26A/SulP transporter domain-containing protein n=1 Tax=Massilia psychrophila TaxID=1603353 RepID=A0A2G8T6Q3_9BURK|nr:hypothetical protein CR103_01040 [Massilia psychrophila]GGE61266.1 hypothetical protein GCM10008020_01780 [Massilia psychrophila]
MLHRDRLISVAAVFAVLLFGVLDGLLGAIAVSLIMLLRRLSESSVTILGRLGDSHDFVSEAAHPQAQPVSGILILRPDSGLFLPMPTEFWRKHSFTLPPRRAAIPDLTDAAFGDLSVDDAVRLARQT